MTPRILFITGTDTDVGKTLLTAMMLSHLRGAGDRALALKPFCSGGRADARLLHVLQEGDLTLDQINPWFFPEPLAPLVAARKHRRKITLQHVLNHIHFIASSINPQVRPSTHPTFQPSKHPSVQRPTLLIEGSGGLLVPLGEDFTVLDLITSLASTTRLETFIVARNKLGTINHTLLTARALRQALALPRHGHHLSRRIQPDAEHSTRLTPTALGPSPPPRVVLMSPRAPDLSSASNPRLLAAMLAPMPVLLLPYLGPSLRTAAAIRTAAVKLRRVFNGLVTPPSTSA